MIRISSLPSELQTVMSTVSICRTQIMENRADMVACRQMATVSVCATICCTPGKREGRDTANQRSAAVAVPCCTTAIPPYKGYISSRQFITWSAWLLHHSLRLMWRYWSLTIPSPAWRSARLCGSWRILERRFWLFIFFCLCVHLERLRRSGKLYNLFKLKLNIKDHRNVLCWDSLTVLDWHTIYTTTKFNTFYLDLVPSPRIASSQWTTESF